MVTYKGRRQDRFAGRRVNVTGDVIVLTEGAVIRLGKAQRPDAGTPTMSRPLSWPFTSGQAWRLAAAPRA